jgi:dienelactone hydrolase
MKLIRNILIAFLILCSGKSFSQKLLLDSMACISWQSLESPSLSFNGMFVTYSIKNRPIGNQTLIIQSTNSDWKKELVGVNEAKITSDNKYALFMMGKDSLAFLTLGTNEIRYVSHVSSFQLNSGSQNEWLIYSLANDEGRLIVNDLKTGKLRSFSNTINKWFSEDGKLLIVKTGPKDTGSLQYLNCIDLSSGQVTKVPNSYKAEQVVLDSEHRQLAFEIDGNIWLYRIGESLPTCLYEQCIAAPKVELSLGSLDHFSIDGNRLFIRLKENAKHPPINNAVQIWSYRDIKLQSEQEQELGIKEYLAVVNLGNHRIIRLQDKVTDYLKFPDSKTASDTLALIQSFECPGEKWSVASRTRWSLISTKNGDKRNLSFLDDNATVTLSPNCKYLIYYRSDIGDYYSYEIATDIIRNLTENIKVSWIDLYKNDRPSHIIMPRGVGRTVWLKNDEAVFIYDQNDIWEIDPLSQKKPINLTNGYGLKNNIVFNFALQEYVSDGIYKGSHIILNAFNLQNKNNGFYGKILGKIGDPNLLNMGSCLYDISYNDFIPQHLSFEPLKATKAKFYLVRRMSAVEAPNYLITKDFKLFRALTNLQPQKKYNWYTTELHHWESLDGRQCQGILYKPENFNPNNKYPVIFHYYERKSYNLNAYLKPEFSDGNLDVASYVSNGYLVFCPDIYYEIGNPMQGTYAAIVSAANYIKRFPFVNAKKMGIEGHSFGGVQTNYLITKTNLFAAACSASGLGDWVSGYGSIFQPWGQSEQGYFEVGQGRMNATLWEELETYINNSAIIHANKITTPLLMMHTKKDDVCPFSNALEFFIGLRRLGKKAWMLLYSEGNHSLSGKEAKDFSIRMMQFFDHYLKDEQAPNWMLDGIDESKKGIDLGFELNSSGRTPGPGLLRPEEQSKIDNLMVTAPATMTFR